MLAHVLRQVPGHTSINQLHSGSMYYKAAGSMRDNASTMCGASWLASGGTKWYAYVLDVGTLPSLSYPHKGCNQPTLNPYMCQCTDNGLATKRYNKECNTALGDSDCTLDPMLQLNIIWSVVLSLPWHYSPALVSNGGLVPCKACTHQVGLWGQVFPARDGSTINGLLVVGEEIVMQWLPQTGL